MRCQRTVGISLFLLLSLACDGVLHAAEPVQAFLGRESAWTGEAVPLIVTLYSPGPFSGVASFDLPELPQTTILRIGGAVVGSEEVDGESTLTQRHEFSVFTQRTGVVEIPPFVVRFKGKPSFVGDSVAVEGRTNGLKFESRRPPGASNLGVVVAATGLSVEQSWNPAETVNIQAGDVIARTITRRITKTSSMMLPPFSTEAIAGVRIYEADPTVEDKVDRGELTATRVDTIKYQFGKPGTFQLPPITFAWWDTEKEEVQQVVLDGLRVQVAAEDLLSEGTSGERQPAGTVRWGLWGGALFAIAVVAWCTKAAVGWWNRRSQAPERVIARRVKDACRSDDARQAYASCMAWIRLLEKETSELEAELGEPWKELSQFLYSGTARVDSWDGDALVAAFAKANKFSRRKENVRPTNSLPSLNP